MDVVKQKTIIQFSTSLFFTYKVGMQGFIPNDLKGIFKIYVMVTLFFKLLNLNIADKEKYNLRTIHSMNKLKSQ